MYSPPRGSRADRRAGAISSSGVVEAIWDYWTYYEPIRIYADHDCISNTQKIIHVVDNILIGLNKSETTAELKGVFGLANVTHDDDFASVLTSGISSWQNRNWDPAENDPSFDLFCGNITSHSIIYPETSGLTETVRDILKTGGYEEEVSALTAPMLNWIGWLGQYSVNSCESDQDSCFSTHDHVFYAQDDISQSWRAWPYQVSTRLPTQQSPNLTEA